MIDLKTEELLSQVRKCIIDCTAEGRLDQANRIAVLYDISYADFVIEHQAEITFARLKL